jgi:isoamylase
MNTLHHSTNFHISGGENYPLGATLYKEGVNFALYSRHAEEVYLLLFSQPGNDPTDIMKIDHCTDHIWHIFVHGIAEGQLYGYKIKGPYNPDLGLRYNEHKLLIDPYARALSSVESPAGRITNTDGLFFAYIPDSDENGVKDTRDSTPAAPVSLVIDDQFNWEGVNKPGLSCEELVIYEVHVRGFTRHPSSGVNSPGTYLGLIEKIPYLKDLGINVVELLPVHQYYTSKRLSDMGLTEYWGYNTICFFAPEMQYGTGTYPGCQVHEFKTMVRELHRAGIEVILDVVYNHTAEGNELGPTLCLRGIDNPVYYALTGDAKEPLKHYVNHSGCGNVVNSEHPQVLRLIMDSLRYWADVMQVDGFRFDLAPILAREKGVYNKDAAFFKTMYQDPVLSTTKLIAEPWDMGTYQVGNFPQRWSEWNGKFRTTVRKFLRGDKGQIKDLAWRLTGSADLYKTGTRYPCNSINFIACHDGFTLHDLFSYNNKHNDENMENNKDGTNNNYSWNCGEEGETSNSEIRNLRKQMIKNGLCLLFFSLGTPMLLGGDEFQRTQGGNNNPYCQDNDTSWFHWDLLKQNNDIYDFCRKAIAFRKRYSILYKKTFYTGVDQDKDNVPDILWFDQHMNPPPWNKEEQQLLCYQIDGSEIPSELGNYHLFFALHGGDTDCVIKIPQNQGMKWYRVADTSLTPGNDFLSPGDEVYMQNQQEYTLKARSIAVFIGR